MTAVRLPLAVTAVGVAAVAVLAWLLVPWQPVPGGMPPAVPVSEVFTAAQAHTGEDVARWSRVWGWSSLVVSLAVSLWLGFGRSGRAVVGRLPGPWWLVTTGAVAGVCLVGTLATLPLSAAQQAHLVDVGLSTQGWGGFARDLVVGQLVTIVFTSLGVLVLVACVRRWPRRWPAVTAVLVGGLVMLGSYVYPILVEPLFNQFTPLPDGALRTQVLALADREGVHVDDVLVADASRRTTTLNAYVSGLGGTRRIVVYDNLLEGVPQDQAMSVVAHELAHVRHNDVLLGTGLGALASVGAICALALLLDSERVRSRAGPAGAPAVTALLVAVIIVGGLLGEPGENAVSRAIEARADRTALEASGDPAAFEAVQRQLALRSLADPTPPEWSRLWFSSHPTVLQRLGLAEAFREADE